MKADRFNAQVWKKSVEARFREDYTERTETKNETKIEAADSLTRLMGDIADRGRPSADG